MSDIIEKIVDIIPKLGIPGMLVAFIVVTWFLGVSLEQTIPGAGVTASWIIAGLFGVLILYIVLKYGKDQTSSYWR